MNLFQNSSHRKHGFTLVELLVVISIISMLSSIVLSAVSRARATARDAVRISGAREVTNAINLYKADTGHYPPATLYYGGNWGYNYSTDPTFLNDLVTSKYLDKIPADPVNDYSRGYMYWYLNNDGNVGGQPLDPVIQGNFVGLDCPGIDRDTVGAVLMFQSEGGGTLNGYTHAMGYPSLNTLCFLK